MFQKALLDYLECIKIKVNIKKIEFAKVWIFVYMLVLLPCMMAGNGKGIALASYYIMVIPMMFGIYSSSVAPIQLPKQMYLCPMELSERYRYIRDIYWIKIITPILAGMVFHAAGAWSGTTDWTEAVLQIYGLTAMLICTSLLEYWRLNTGDEQKDKKHPYTKKMRRLQGVSITGMLIALFYKMILVYNARWHWEEKSLFQIYSLVSLVAMFIFSVWSCTYIKPMLKQLTIYERSFDKEELC